MRRLHYAIAIFMLLLAGAAGTPVHAQQTGPAPRLKQLQIGCYTYGGSYIWNSTSLRQWYAERYSFLIGSDNGAASKLNEMRAVNDSMRGLIYDLFVRYTDDTVNLKNWAAQKGYDFDSLILRVKNTGPGDSVVIRVSNISGQGFARYVTTRPGGILLAPGYTTAQTRYCFDFRNPKVGEYLADTWKALVEQYGYDGAFIDEECLIGYTNNNPAGLYPLIAAFKDITSDYWLVGSPYSSLQHNWGNDFDLEDADNTHSYIDIRDSLRRARDGWMGIAGTMMTSWGYDYAPNFAAHPTNALPNWTYEGRRAAQLARSYIMGEYSYFYPGADNYETNCNVAKQAIFSARNDNVKIYLGWIRMGQYDLQQGKSYDRSKMSGLGFMLDMTFPGTSKTYFSPCVKNGQVDVFMNRDVGGTIADDTTTMWCYAWGKYFGVPLATRDSATKGTDPAGQSYTIHKVTLMNPNNTSQVQTLAVGRYARGANFDLASTRVTVALGGNYYELQPSGAWTGPVSSASVGNSEWRIFAADTTLANNGVSSGSSTDVTPPSGVNDLSSTTGSQTGELIISWTAPGDDDNVGRATTYAFRYRDSIDGPVTSGNWDQSQIVTLSVVPAQAGTTQQATLTASHGLTPGAAYYIAMRAADEAGNSGDVSNSPLGKTNGSISTGDDSCLVVALHPQDGSTSADRSPTLVVANISCDSGSTKEYFFDISQSDLFDALVTGSSAVSEGVDSTSWTVDEQLAPGTYFWRARVSGYASSPTSIFSIEASPFAFPTTVNLSAGGSATITNLSAGANIIIVSVSGEPIRRWTSLTGESVVWDGKNQDGQQVASGVYLWHVENSDHKGKLIVVR